MYSYEWDIETGGLLLNTSPLSFSKEPRPVYYKELDILGFDKHWNYDKNDTYPYMWAEANNYWYRGRLVAKTKGGTLYTAPELIHIEAPEPDHQPLRFVDIPAMVEKNRDILEKLAQDTIKKIYNTYIEFKEKVDVFYVAFSGGKDSVVTLDLVQKALPHNDFKVLFGDTGMEFPDTYEVVDKIQTLCENDGIEFFKSKSDFEPEQTWREFGPPAQTLRWCCSVHKTTPQIILLRKYLKKDNFTGMAFIGVRADESATRSDYDYVSLGEKHKGQYSCNPILEWNSAELFIYIFQKKLILNDAYKKGNSRAGCLVCPMAASKNEYFKSICYPQETKNYFNIIKDCNGKDLNNSTSLREYLETGGWKARRNGRELAVKVEKYSESSNNGEFKIIVNNATNDWKEWIKTIGELAENQESYILLHRDTLYRFDVETIENGYIVTIPENYFKSNPTFGKLFKNVFRKSAYCSACKECQADCHNGSIIFEKGKVKIFETCKHCSECHKVDKGCLLYKSVVLPKGGILMNSKFKSLNCYSNHGPKLEWFEQYLKFKNEFSKKHSLGSNMYDFFKRFLRDANLLDTNGFTQTANVIDRLSLDSEQSWGIMLTNLSYTPQIQWYIKNICMGQEYSRDLIVTLLESEDVNSTSANQMILAYKRILELPFGNLGLGTYVAEKNKIVLFKRTLWQNPDPIVILYSLYKFAENCGEYYQFTLTRLLNHDIESVGVSPTEIFGLNRDDMEKILNGLSINYPDFITASFTLDLDNITLRNDKTSKDVLELF